MGTSSSALDPPRFNPALADAAEQLIGALERVDYVNARQRGYLCATSRRRRSARQVRMVDTVASPTSPIATASAWTIVAGTPGANPA